MCCVLSALGCQVHAGQQRPTPASGGLDAVGLAHRSGSRWLWVEAECTDGALELGSVGLDRELTVQTSDIGENVLIFETELPTEGCFSSAQWSAEPATDAGLWRFEPQSVVSLPPEAACGPVEREPTSGSLHVYGDELEIVTRNSPWCRGFDARFVYRSAESSRLTPRQLVTRYAGAFNRRDPDALADLFVAGGSLVEPFTKTDDGNYKRHEGHTAIRGWYASVFASTPWSALRLISIAPGAGPDQVIVDWEYMDGRLAQPFHGRNLFVVAEGEIYETELQLVDDPEALRDKEEHHASAVTSTPASSASTVAR